MRICFLSRRYFPAISGMSVYAKNMTKALVDRGHEIVMISQYREDQKGIGVYGGGAPPDESWMEVVGLRSRGEECVSDNQPADFEMDLHTMVETALRMHEIKPFDLVHAQYCYPNGLAALEISRRLDIPNVVSIQGGDGHWVGLCCDTHKQAMNAVLNHAMALLIGCDSFAEEVCENHDIPKEHLTIIPGATNTDKFRPVREIGTLHQPVRLLYHGRVDSRKGSLDFVHACKKVESQGYPIEIIISGIGPDFDETKELVRTLGLEHQAKFLGSIPYQDVPEVYGKGDIFVSPTYAEGFSNTILEAMASGLPIISTNAIGVSDCLTHNVNALLTEPGDIQAIAQAMIRLIEDRELRTRISQAAYNEVISSYSWPVVAQRIEGIYKKVSEKPITTSWQDAYNYSQTIQEADMSCRFRAEPHLL